MFPAAQTPNELELQFAPDRLCVSLERINGWRVLATTQGGLQPGDGRRLSTHACCYISLAQASFGTRSKHLPQQLKLRAKSLILSFHSRPSECRFLEIAVLHDFFTSASRSRASFNSLGGVFSDFLMKP
jgi:hypothetical protein